MPQIDFINLAKPNESVAALAAGCFWGVEEIIKEIPGVLKTQVGYIGGSMDHPTYDVVKRGQTGHAEAVQILFDPKVLPYEKLLEWFFRLHDPTTLNRQEGDVGTQYRSAIFTYGKDQQDTAKKFCAEMGQSGRWTAPVVTEVVPASIFWRAEDYHQDYLAKNPNGYRCHYLRPEF